MHKTYGRCMVRDIERGIPSVQQLAKHAEFVYLCKNLKAEIMGLYLNPNADAFQMGLNTEIYVDKSLILSELKFANLLKIA